MRTRNHVRQRSTTLYLSPEEQRALDAIMAHHRCTASEAIRTLVLSYHGLYIVKTSEVAA